MGNKGKGFIICMGLLTSIIGLISMFTSFEVVDKNITIYDGYSTHHPIIKPFELIWCLFGIILIIIGFMFFVTGLVIPTRTALENEI